MQPEPEPGGYAAEAGARERDEQQRALADGVAEKVSRLVLDVDGVYRLSGKAPPGLSKKQKERRPRKGVRVAVKENTILINIQIIVRFGRPIPDIARRIQNKTRDFISSEYRDYQLVAVNVRVDGVEFDQGSEGGHIPRETARSQGIGH